MIQQLVVYEEDALEGSTCMFQGRGDGEASSSGGGFLLLRKDGVTICLKRSTLVHVEVEIGDVLVNSWVLTALGVSCGDTIEVVPLALQVARPLPRASHIVLHFRQCRSYQHWDERGANSSSSNLKAHSFSAPCAWSSVWPVFVNITSASKLGSFFVVDKPLVQGALVGIDMLDMTMIFQVSIHFEEAEEEEEEKEEEERGGGGGKEKLFVLLPTTGFSSLVSVCFVLDDDDDDETLQPKGPHEGLLPPKRVTHSNNQLLARIVSLVNAVFDRRGQWCGARSILVSGPIGSGKSSLLKGLVDCARKRMGLGSPCCLLMLIEGSGGGHVFIESTTTVCKSEDKQEEVEDDGSEERKEVISILLQLHSASSSSGGLRLSAESFALGAKEQGTVLVIIDDLDAILSAFGDEGSVGDGDEDTLGRGDVAFYSEEEFERSRLLAFLLRRLLSLLSLPSCRLRIAVVGATSLLPSSISPSCTGTPAFDKIMLVPRPALQDREVVLESLFVQLTTGLFALEDLTEEKHGERSESNVLLWSSKMAAITAGYLPGDLACVVKRMEGFFVGIEAAAKLNVKVNHIQSNALEPSLMSGSSNNKVIPWRLGLSAAAAVLPSQIQEFGKLASSSYGQGGGGRGDGTTSWQDFCGYLEITKGLRRLLNASKSKHATTRFAQLPPRGILLYGPSGCGKTHLARIIAAESRSSFVSIRSSDLLSKYFGQTEARIRDLFQKARAAAPCTLFFDDFDVLACKRGADDADGTGVQARVLSTFLNELDGVVAKSEGGSNGEDNSVLVIVACNDIDIVDEALLRPGRVQHHFYLGLPTQQDVADILTHSMSSIPCEIADVNVQELVDALMPLQPICVEVHALCRSALMIALRDAVKSGRVQEALRVTHNDFLRALALKNEDEEEKNERESFSRQQQPFVTTVALGNISFI